MERLPLSYLFAASLLMLVSCGPKASFNRAPLPFGSVDLPQPKTIVQGTLLVSGWVLANEPVQVVSVYIDTEFITSVPVAIARPDVAAAKPAYKNAANSGFGVAIDSATIAQGWHEVVVQARTESGAVRDLASVPVLVQR